MKSLSSRRLSGAIVFTLVAFGIVNAAMSMFSTPRASQPIALTSTQQIVESAGVTTAMVSAASR